MDCNRLEIKINEPLTDKVWLKFVNSVSGCSDVKLLIEGCEIFLNEMAIPEEISSISIENVVFRERIKISGLSHGRYFSIKNAKGHPLCGVRIEDVSCNLFEFDDLDETIESEFYEHVIITFSSCEFSHFQYSSFFLPSFKKVVFSEKVRIKSRTENNDNALHFSECIFVNYLECELLDFKNKSLFITNSKTLAIDDVEDAHVTFLCRESHLSNLEIKNSNLIGMHIKFFQLVIDSIEINKSIIDEMDLHTVDDGHTKTEIYNLYIRNSEVGILLLNNRTIVHPLSFSGSKFKSPPSFFGAKIPSGSIFPKRDGFLGRNGKRDAACYRVLRSQMESQRDRNFEGMFFSLEQESLCNEENGIEHYISKIYHIFSDYGTDYIKPLLLLLFFAVTFTFIYGLYMSESIGPSYPIDWGLLKSSFIYSLKQILQPFSSLKDMTPLSNEKQELSLVIVLVSILQSFISLVCIALSGLAIRWRFKRD